MTSPLPAQLPVVAPRRPQQARSRASLDRVLAAARDLLARNGYDGFTLLEVSQQAQVSIGSIYGRVTGKEDLIRLVHAAVVADLAAEEDALLTSLHDAADMSVLLTAFLSGFGDLLRRYGPSLRPLMLRANSDRLIGEAGVQAYHRFFEQAVALILGHARDIRHPDPEKAVRFCLFIAYSAFRNALGLGSTQGESRDQDWEGLKADVTGMCLAHLGIAA